MSVSVYLRTVDDEWYNCQRCPLGSRAFKHVQYELLGPSRLVSTANRVDVLFIGEGPGMSEDTLGRPFIGPSGRLLRQSLEAIGAHRYLVLLANLLACRPHDLGSDKNRAPQPHEIEACRPRLINIIEISQPRIICCLGRVPEHNIEPVFDTPNVRRVFKGPVHCIPHPSLILRNGGKRGERYGPWIIQLRKVFEELDSLGEEEGKEKAA